MQKITTIIPTKNEECNIREAIQSVYFSDEIIIVDSFSTDKTVQIAKSLSAKVIQRDYENSASQKNWAIPQTKYNWILILDADERIPSELAKEIKHILTQQTTETAFWIYRNNYFMGKQVRFSGWQNDKVIRLFKKGECYYEKKHVHAEISTKGKIGYLKNKINHHTCISIKDYLLKIKRYANWQSKDYQNKTGLITPYHFIIKPLIRFIKHYFFQLGFLDGMTGMTIASIQAYAVFLRYIKIRDMRNKKIDNQLK